MVIRNINLTDWKHIMAVQASCYPNHLIETEFSLKTKQNISKETCFVIEIDNAIAGYLISHPCDKGVPPALNCELGSVDLGTHLHLHDFCISEKFRGYGYGGMVFRQLINSDFFRQFKSFSVVSVMNSQSFWEKMGFIEEKTISIELKGYGEAARYLTLCT